MSVEMCPECKQGKCLNCTVTVLGTDDLWTYCPHRSTEEHLAITSPARQQAITPYDGGTSSGHSGTDTSQARSEREDKDGTTGERQRKVMEMIVPTGRYGLTVKQVRSLTGLHHGQASSTLSVLHKEGLLARLKETRDRCKVYVHPDYVGDRETEQHGRNSRPDSEAAKRVIAFLQAREGMRGLDPEEIYGLNSNQHLMVSDLWALIQEARS